MEAESSPTPSTFSSKHDDEIRQLPLSRIQVFQGSVNLSFVHTLIQNFYHTNFHLLPPSYAYGPYDKYLMKLDRSFGLNTVVEDSWEPIALPARQFEGPMEYAVAITDRELAIKGNVLRTHWATKIGTEMAEAVIKKFHLNPYELESGLQFRKKVPVIATGKAKLFKTYLEKCVYPEWSCEGGVWSGVFGYTENGLEIYRVRMLSDVYYREHNPYEERKRVYYHG